MPREMIVSPKPVESPSGEVGETLPGLSVGWNKTGWTQLYMMPPEAESTGDWMIVDLDRGDINRLIRTLRRARDAAFGRDE